MIRDPEGSSWGVVQWHLPGGSPWSSKLRAGHKPQVLVVTLPTAGARSKQDGRNEKSMIKLIYTYVCYVIHNLLNILYQGCQLFKSLLLQM